MLRKFSFWERVVFYFVLKEGWVYLKIFQDVCGNYFMFSEWLNQEKLVKYFSKVKSNDLCIV